jgi:hypothetical protein
MQRTADFHDRLSDPCLPEATDVVDDAAAIDATVDVLDTHAATGDTVVHSLLLAREGTAPGLLRRHDGFHLVQRNRQEAQILE